MSSTETTETPSQVVPKTDKRRSLLPSFGWKKSSGQKSPKSPEAKTSIQEQDAKPLSVGDRVLIGGVKVGILRYQGKAHFAEGLWCGIELEEPVGKHDGEIAGERYFTCKDQHGIFAPLHKVELVKAAKRESPPGGEGPDKGSKLRKLQYTGIGKKTTGIPSSKKQSEEETEESPKAPPRKSGLPCLKSKLVKPKSLLKETELDPEQEAVVAETSKECPQVSLTDMSEQVEGAEAQYEFDSAVDFLSFSETNPKDISIPVINTDLSSLDDSFLTPVGSEECSLDGILSTELAEAGEFVTREQRDLLSPMPDLLSDSIYGINQLMDVKQESVDVLVVSHSISSTSSSQCDSEITGLLKSDDTLTPTDALQLDNLEASEVQVSLHPETPEISVDLTKASPLVNQLTWVSKEDLEDDEEEEKDQSSPDSRISTDFEIDHALPSDTDQKKNNDLIQLDQEPLLEADIHTIKGNIDIVHSTILSQKELLTSDEFDGSKSLDETPCIKPSTKLEEDVKPITAVVTKTEGQIGVSFGISSSPSSDVKQLMSDLEAGHQRGERPISMVSSCSADTGILSDFNPGSEQKKDRPLSLVSTSSVDTGYQAEYDGEGPEARLLSPLSGTDGALTDFSMLGPTPGVMGTLAEMDASEDMPEVDDTFLPEAATKAAPPSMDLPVTSVASKPEEVHNVPRHFRDRDEVPIFCYSETSPVPEGLPLPPEDVQVQPPASEPAAASPPAAAVDATAASETPAVSTDAAASVSDMAVSHEMTSDAASPEVPEASTGVAEVSMVTESAAVTDVAPVSMLTGQADVDAEQQPMDVDTAADSCGVGHSVSSPPVLPYIEPVKQEEIESKTDEQMDTSTKVETATLPTPPSQETPPPSPRSVQKCTKSSNQSEKQKPETKTPIKKRPSQIGKLDTKKVPSKTASGLKPPSGVTSTKTSSATTKPGAKTSKLLNNKRKSDATQQSGYPPGKKPASPTKPATSEKRTSKYSATANNVKNLKHGESSGDQNANKPTSKRTTTLSKKSNMTSKLDTNKPNPSKTKEKLEEKSKVDSVKKSVSATSRLQRSGTPDSQKSSLKPHSATGQRPLSAGRVHSPSPTLSASRVSSVTDITQTDSSHNSSMVSQDKAPSVSRLRTTRTPLKKPSDSQGTKSHLDRRKSTDVKKDTTATNKPEPRASRLAKPKVSTGGTTPASGIRAPSVNKARKSSIPPPAPSKAAGKAATRKPSSQKSSGTPDSKSPPAASPVPSQQQPDVVPAEQQASETREMELLLQARTLELQTQTFELQARTQELESQRQALVTRTRQLEACREHIRRNAHGFDAMVALVKYMDTGLHAFQCPAVTAQLKHTEEQLGHAHAQIGELMAEQTKLDEELSALLLQQEQEREQQERSHRQEMADLEALWTTKMENQATKLKGQHDEAMKTLKLDHEQKMCDERDKQHAELAARDRSHQHELEKISQEHQELLDKLQEQHETQLQEITHRFEHIKVTLHEKVEQLRSECEEMRQREKMYVEQFQRESDIKVQLALQPYKHLPQEIESLKAVLEIKTQEVHELRRHKLHMEKQLEEIPVARDKIKSLEQKGENLEAIIKIKADYEKQLTEKHQLLMRKFDKESKANKRLSMDNEELMWRISQGEMGSPDPVRKISSSVSGSVSPTPSEGKQYRSSTASNDSFFDRSLPSTPPTKSNLRRSGTYDLLDQSEGSDDAR